MKGPHVCIHGHFYQPPRETPWLEEIETQDSARPFHDWNQRITAECYAPNTAARILGPKERITAIVNNYARMSFNFGPTLLSWLEKQEPEVYQAILDADEESRRRFSGHGSALAQAYNHTILPLASKRDKKTQVLWGIRDFTYRFQRPPEGMWLPETAVDLETLDILAEHGIRFTILAPRQVRRIRLIGTDNWQNVNETQVDTCRPYLCRLASGRTICLYFYDGSLSREVAFGDLLKQGQVLADRLMGDKKPGPEGSWIRHIAIDGETFGHHHRFGEMALSYCLHAIENHPQARLTNYAEFLDQNTPVYEAEILEKSSWSCAHGIERWRSDCGCQTGAHPGWHQAWRAPLRAAMNRLNEALSTVYEKQLQSWTQYPWDLRNGYIDVVLDRTSQTRSEFLHTFSLQELEAQERVKLWKLLEMQRAAGLMFTSCGWFFEDISGIEPIQILVYAARAMQLARDVAGIELEPRFLSELRKAPSNHPDFRNGEDLYQKKVRPGVLDNFQVGVHAGVVSLFLEKNSPPDFTGYEITSADWVSQEKNEWKVGIGRFLIRSRLTQEQETVGFAALHRGEHHLLASARTASEVFSFPENSKKMQKAFQAGAMELALDIQIRFLGEARFSLSHLFKDARQEILLGLLDTALEGLDTSLRPFYTRYAGFASVARNMDLPLPHALPAGLGFLRHRDLIKTLGQDTWSKHDLSRFTNEIRDRDFALENTVLIPAFSRSLLAFLEELAQDPKNDPLWGRVDELLEAAAELGLDLELWKSQNLFFELMHKQVPESGYTARKDGRNTQRVKRLAHIGAYLHVKVNL